MRKIKKYFIIILLSIFTLTTVETSSLNFSAYIVQAKASSSTKRKAQEAYRKFLTQRRYRYFTLWDIDKDGLKELLVTDGRERVGNSPTKTSVYKGYKQDKIEMRGDRAEMSDFPLYLNTVAGGLDCRDQTIGGFSFVVKIYALPVVEIIG